MKALYRIICLLYLTSILGCGSSDGSSSRPAGADVIQKYALTIKGQPTTSSVFIPEQLTSALWSEKEDLCQQAGYTLAPYSGQDLSLTQYEIFEMYYPNVVITHTGLGGITSTVPEGLGLYLWIFTKDDTTVCSYVSALEDDVFSLYLAQGVVNSGMFAVNDANIK